MKITFDLLYRIMTERPESLDEIEIMIGDFYSIFGYLRAYHALGRLGKRKVRPERPFWVGDCDIADGASFLTADEFVNTPLYGGRSLRDVWDEVDIVCAVGMPPEIWLEQLKLPGMMYDAAHGLWH